MGKDAKMTVTQLAGGATVTSVEKGGGADNPTDPQKLTALQERRQITLEYQGVSTFTIDYELAGNNKNGFRNFIFSPEASVQGQAPIPCPSPSPPTPAPTKNAPTPAPTKNAIFPPVNEKAMVFVVDISSSMGCYRYPGYNGYYCLLPKMKEEFKHQIDNLKGYQWFSIVSFSQQAWTWKQTLQRVTPQNIASAKQWVDDLKYVSGTYYAKALEAAYNIGKPHGVDLNAIYFLSDGEPNDCWTSSYEACFKDYYAKDPKVKIRTILLRKSKSATLYLEAMSKVTGGDYHEAYI
jgi:hypothetical protein